MLILVFASAKRYGREYFQVHRDDTETKLRSREEYERLKRSGVTAAEGDVIVVGGSTPRPESRIM
jgi:hypothetical protein